MLLFKRERCIKAASVGNEKMEITAKAENSSHQNLNDLQNNGASLSHQGRAGDSSGFSYKGQMGSCFFNWTHF